jgi:hypothetical protein
MEIARKVYPDSCLKQIFNCVQVILRLWCQLIWLVRLWPAWTMDGSLVGFLLSLQICQLINSQTLIYGYGFSPSSEIRNWELKSHKLRMLPCLSPCVWSGITHPLLEMFNFTIHVLWNIPVTKVTLEKSGLGPEYPVKPFFQSFWLNNRILRGDGRHFYNLVLFSYAIVPLKDSIIYYRRPA